MKRLIIISSFIFLWMLATNGMADTFKHKETGESFTGFVTQKSTAGKTLVYNSEEGKMKPLILRDYEVTYDRQGRRDTVSLLRLTQPEIMLSETISKKAAAAITEASNKGPQAIIVQIDSPGGRGEYMKYIAQAIAQTKNCPIYAYISGESSGGAYSAAALVALGCDRIYINPIAGIGAVGPATVDMAGTGYGAYLETYCPGSLVTYATLADSFAQEHGRPIVLAQAMVNKGLSVIEVANIDGSKDFVDKESRQPTQTVIRTLSEGMPPEVIADLSTATAVDVSGKVVSLTAQQAVDSGLVDSLANSISDVLADRQMQEMKITPIPGVESLIKKYLAVRRNIADGLVRIEQQEKQVEVLNKQFTDIDNQLRTGTRTREVAQGNPRSAYRSNRSKYFSSDRIDDPYDTVPGDTRNLSNQPRTYRGQLSQSITMTEPAANIQIVHQQLGAALEDLLGEYRRTLNLAKRWPGALPVKMSLPELQKYMTEAQADLDNLSRYQPPYLDPVQFQQPDGRPRRRINNPNRY